MKTNENRDGISLIQYVYIGHQFENCQGSYQNVDSLKVTSYFYGQLLKLLMNIQH